MAWDIALDETLLRSELHDRWGGGRYGGMEPSVLAESVFLFTKPGVGEKFGYNFDGWHADGTFHYTGDGQEGDQLLDFGGNKSLMEAEARGRAIRLFRSKGTSTTYLGQFRLTTTDQWHRADAPDKWKEIRSVLVFRLEPVGDVVQVGADAAPAGDPVPVAVPLESDDVETYAKQRPDEPAMAVRREAKLVRDYAQWLMADLQPAVRHRIPAPGGGYLFTDMYVTAVKELIEAKSSAARVHVRSGLGQILDYARFLSHNSRCLLLPTKPSDDLVSLLHQYGVGVIWRDGKSFQRSDAPTT